MISSRNFSPLIILLLALLLGFAEANGQNPDVTLQIQTQPVVNNAQVISLATLGIDRRGRGQTLATMVLRNNGFDRVTDLYFNLEVKSSRFQIATAYQRQGSPFSLDEFEVIVTNNNLIQDGISGIEKLEFESEITDQGEEFINSLEGSTRLPGDIYTLKVTITQGANLAGGGNVVAEDIVTLGANSSSAETRDIFLRFPGDVLGNEYVLNNSLPEFNWDGESGIEYRLLVVRDDGENTAEAQLQIAASSEPALENGSPGMGQLQEFENVDAIVEKSSFQMPPNGVQQFKAGEKYYWRVVALIRGAGTTQEINSEIWEFTLSDPGGNSTSSVADLLQQPLTTLIGPNMYNQLSKSGYKLSSIELDGQTYSGPSMVSELQTFVNRINRGEITAITSQKQ